MNLRHRKTIPSTIDPGLPAEWLEAFRRDAAGLGSTLADPLPERRAARLLGAFIVSGLVFMLLPGTLLGVVNLLGISSERQAEAASVSWIQAHGHAQLFGWVGTFMAGISLYAVPKFRGGRLRSLPLAWAMWIAWVAAVGVRWAAGVSLLDPGWGLPSSALTEFLVSLLLPWQVSAKGPSYSGGQVWEAPVFAGLGGLVLTMAAQLVSVFPARGTGAIEISRDRLLVHLALWAFCYPVAWGFACRFLPPFLGLRPSGRTSARAGLWLLIAAVGAAIAGQEELLAAGAGASVIAASWSLRIFHPPERPPKLIGVHPSFPWFARLPFAWLLISALLAFGAGRPGMLGASRHAFTVGFLATLIFAVGPRILPSFVNSRELRSKSLMLAALVFLTAGCALRVASEPLAYTGVSGFAWSLLPVSAVLELAGVALFAVNIGVSLATRVPAWFGREQVRDSMPVYWYISSYPAARKVLVEAGLKTLAQARALPRSLTLAEAAAADRVDPKRLVEALGAFFEARLARSLKKGKGPGPQGSASR